MKKSVLSVLFALMMTLSLLTQIALPAAAESLTDAEDTTAVVLDAAQELPSDPSEPFTTEPATVSVAKFPVLTVSAISNYFGRIDAEYNEFTREVTVTYMMKSSKLLLSADWTLSYDAELLTVDPKKNTVETVSPIMKKEATMSIDAKQGVIRYTATDLRMFDFSTAEAAFAQIVFDVPELSPSESEITKVDLSVNDIVVSEPDPQTGFAMQGKDIVLVANGKGQKSSAAKKVQVSKYTTITPSTFEEPSATKPATEDEAITTEPPETQPSTAIAEQTTASKPQEKPKKDEGLQWLHTGTWYIAALILVILMACSIVLFVMRKRDIYND